MKSKLCFVRLDPNQICGVFAALGAAAAKSNFTPSEQKLSYALFHISRSKRRHFYISSTPYSVCISDSRAMLPSDRSHLYLGPNSWLGLMGVHHPGLGSNLLLMGAVAGYGAAAHPELPLSLSRVLPGHPGVGAIQREVQGSLGPQERRTLEGMRLPMLAFSSRFQWSLVVWFCWMMPWEKEGLGDGCSVALGARTLGESWS